MGSVAQRKSAKISLVACSPKGSEDKSYFNWVDEVTGSNPVRTPRTYDSGEEKGYFYTWCAEKPFSFVPCLINMQVAQMTDTSS
jgi:hypothetical protein